MQPINRLLIANRGEIAARVIRCCKKLGIHSIALFSDADRKSPYVELADEAHHLGPSDATRSYLNIDAVLDVAKRSQAKAIHPGYGFLAENPEFVRRVIEAGIIFIGPTEATMQQLGHKHLARALAQKLGIPVAPGFETVDSAPTKIAKLAKSIPLPLLVKAVAGGGGRGMRRVDRYEDLAVAIAEAEREAGRSFGDGRVIVERLISPARHIEVQLIGDSHGNVCHLFERDCSIQRNYQKIIEEAPARNLPSNVRDRLHESAVKIAKEVKLIGAATAEFLVPEQSGDDLEPFYFLEVNPRLQVEHPVTEALTGIDIVELQIKVAQGEKLPFKQQDIHGSGSAIECRICAESPANAFRPTTGQIRRLELPSPQDYSEVRLEHSLREDLIVSPFYDSLLAKLVVKRSTFAETSAVASSLLKQMIISGLDTNIGFLGRILTDEEFLSKPPSTKFLDERTDLLHDKSLAKLVVGWTIAFLIGELDRENEAPHHDLRLSMQKQSYQPNLCLVVKCSEFSDQVVVQPQNIGMEQQGESRKYFVRLKSDNRLLEFIPSALPLSTMMGEWDSTPLPRPTITSSHREMLEGNLELIFNSARVTITHRMEAKANSDQASQGESQIFSPLPGRISKILVTEGTTVQPGSPLLAIESMKMEHNITAVASGSIVSINVKEGEQVQEGGLLITMGASKTAQPLEAQTQLSKNAKSAVETSPRKTSRPKNKAV